MITLKEFLQTYKYFITIDLYEESKFISQITSIDKHIEMFYDEYVTSWFIKDNILVIYLCEKG